MVTKVTNKVINRLSAFRIMRTLLAMLLASLMASAYSAPKTVLVLGDSLSAEYGLARGTGWVALAEARIRSENIDAIVINA
ncbi:MAG: hypothetical protein J0626_03270, partial [Rhodospirillaceae bacterium]|nr:hypothetical protein [Rhodospirillaceae bacterium]